MCFLLFFCLFVSTFHTHLFHAGGPFTLLPVFHTICERVGLKLVAEDSFLLSVAAGQVTPFRGSYPTENMLRRGAFAREEKLAASDCSVSSI